MIIIAYVSIVAALDLLSGALAVPAPTPIDDEPMDVVVTRTDTHVQANYY
jgi:hypothetical protein